MSLTMQATTSSLANAEARCLAVQACHVFPWQARLGRVQMRMVRKVKMVRKVRMVRIVRIHPSRLRIVSTVNPTKPNATPNQTKPRI